MNATLSIRSLNQDVNGLSDGYATLSQFLGTYPFYMLIYIESSSSLITINPLIAFFNSINELLITVNNLLNLCISYNNTVLNELINPYLSGLNKSFLPYALSSNAGKFFLISLALSITISSGDLPPATPPILGYILKIV